MDLSHWIERNAGFTPDKPAILCGDRVLTYRELNDEITRAAWVLREKLAIRYGDRVAFLGYNCPEQIILMFACAHIGAILTLVSWRLAAAEHERIFGDCTPKIIIAGAAFVGELDDKTFDTNDIRLVALDQTETLQKAWLDYDKEFRGRDEIDPVLAAGGPDDACLIVYTSGTTGMPKGAILSQRAVFTNAVNAIHMHGMTAGDIILTTLPLFHVGGLNIQTMPALHIGATVLLHETFVVEQVFDTIDNASPTLTVLVPAQLSELIKHPRWHDTDMSCLRMITTGSTLVPDRLISEVRARGTPLVQVYGCTETCPIAAYQIAGDEEAGTGSGCKPALHCELSVVDNDGVQLGAGNPGEILVRGENVMTGYWNNPQATSETMRDGWVLTGDIGHFDTRGYLYIDDRKKDMIISGGENIYPAELENILAESPMIREAAVVGRPDEKWGETVVAVIVPENPQVTEETVIGLFEGRIARFKRPREVVFAERLPRNVMGKVQKDELRALVLGSHSKQAERA